MKLKAKDFIFVGIQFLLFLIYVFEIEFLSLKLPKYLNTFFLFISIIGFLIIIIALLQLNKNLSPFPTPKSNSELIQTGLYKYVRHPIYTGIIISVFGFGLYTNSGYRSIIALFLLILFYYKSSYEENLLLKKYSNYFGYKNKVGRFFPKF